MILQIQPLPVIERDIPWINNVYIFLFQDGSLTEKIISRQDQV